MTTEAVMFSLLRAEVCGGTVTEEEKTAISEEMPTEIFALTKKHDLAHIAGNALSKLGLLGDNEISKKFKQVSMQAVYRDVRINSEYQKLCKTLEEAQIPFIPLKGAVMRAYYPNPWMRTSCDVDILVKETQLNTAAKVLEEVLGYRFVEKTTHDLSFFLPAVYMLNCTLTWWKTGGPTLPVKC